MSEKKKPTNQQAKKASQAANQKSTSADKSATEANKSANKADPKVDNKPSTPPSQKPATKPTTTQSTNQTKPSSANKEDKASTKAVSPKESKTPQTTSPTNEALKKTSAVNSTTSNTTENNNKKTTPVATSTPSSKSAQSSTTNQNSTPASGNIKQDDKTNASTTAKTPPPPTKIGDSDNENNAKDGNGLSILAIAIALAAAGLGVYNLLNKDNTEAADKLASLEQRVETLESTSATDDSQAGIASLNKQVTQLDSQINALSNQDSMSKEDIAALIEQELTAQNEQAVTPEQIKQYIDSELGKISRASNANAGLSEQEVQTQIKQALASFSQDSGSAPKFDFSQEIAKIKQSEQNAQQTAEKINQRADEIQQTLAEQAKSIQTQIAQAKQQANPFPVLNLLRLANASAKIGDTLPSALYLEQAAAEFDAFNLNQEPYENYKAEIEQKAKEFREIATQEDPAEKLDAIIADVDRWPFKQSALSNEQVDEQAEADSGFMASLKGIGKDILDNTVTVTKNDDEGLSWINENAQLQQLIRQNARLDLAYARNALSYHDSDTFTTTAQRLQDYISRYFDESDASVSKALDTLSGIKPQQPNLPNLSELIEQFSQTATKE